MRAIKESVGELKGIPINVAIRLYRVGYRRGYETCYQRWREDRLAPLTRMPEMARL